MYNEVDTANASGEILRMLAQLFPDRQFDCLDVRVAAGRNRALSDALYRSLGIRVFAGAADGRRSTAEDRSRSDARINDWLRSAAGSGGLVMDRAGWCRIVAREAAAMIE